MECPLQACKEKKRSKVHTLIKKDKPLCLHTLLGYCIPSKEESSSHEKTKPEPKIDREATTKYVLEKITKYVPSMTSQATSEFLVRNHQFIQRLVLNQDISDVINKTVPTKCSFCEDSFLTPWPYKPKKSYFLSMSHFREIQIETKTCKICKVAYYPELYSEGMFPLHNKFIISFDLIMDFYNQLVTGSSLIENVEAKFLLLAKCNGFEEENMQTNLSNHAKNIEKYVIATIASLG